MNRIEFDNLDLIGQINYVNEELKQGRTLRNITDDIGIARSSMRNRFKKLGYTYDKVANMYIKTMEEVKQSPKKITGVEPKEQNTSKSHRELQKAIETNEEYKCLMKEFRALQEQFNEVYHWYEKQSNNEVLMSNNESLNIREFKGEPINRTFKLYPEVQKDFKKFCEKNKPCLVQDIISQALSEFMEKYK